MTTDYLVTLQTELAHKIAQRDQLQADLDSLEEDITRLDTQISLERERQARSTKDGKLPDVTATARPDLSKATLEEAVLQVFEYFNDVMDASQITANVRLFGYRFRSSTSNPAASVNAALSRLVSASRVLRVSQGHYSLPSAYGGPPARTRDDQGSVVVKKIRELNARLPFVGLTLFRDRYLPQIVGPTADDGERQVLINNLVEKGAVEVYSVSNPSNPERGTAAIRVVEKGRVNGSGRGQ